MAGAGPTNDDAAVNTNAHNVLLLRCPLDNFPRAAFVSHTLCFLSLWERIEVRASAALLHTLTLPSPSGRG
jgi:hypothetical protein